MLEVVHDPLLSNAAQAHDQVGVNHVQLVRAVAERVKHVPSDRALGLVELVPLPGPLEVDNDHEVHIWRAPGEVILGKLLGRRAKELVDVVEQLPVAVAVAPLAEVTGYLVVSELRYAHEHTQYPRALGIEPLANVHVDPLDREDGQHIAVEPIGGTEGDDDGVGIFDAATVSYTHLTLPTKA